MFPALYAILDPIAVRLTLLDSPGKLADAGVQLIQLRDKRGSSRKKFTKKSQALVGCSSSRDGMRIIVNDRPDIAAIAGASGVHVARKTCPWRKRARSANRRSG